MFQYPCAIINVSVLTPRHACHTRANKQNTTLMHTHTHAHTHASLSVASTHQNKRKLKWACCPRTYEKVSSDEYEWTWLLWAATKWYKDSGPNAQNSQHYANVVLEYMFALEAQFAMNTTNLEYSSLTTRPKNAMDVCGTSCGFRCIVMENPGGNEMICFERNKNEMMCMTNIDLN